MPNIPSGSNCRNGPMGFTRSSNASLKQNQTPDIGSITYLLLLLLKLLYLEISM